MPPGKDDLTWFRFMLMVLVEVACPNGQIDRADAEFLEDITLGIAIAR